MLVTYLHMLTSYEVHVTRTVTLEKPIFCWRTRYFGEESGVYFGGVLSYFAEHGLVRTSEEYKISPWLSVSAKNFASASN